MEGPGRETIREVYKRPVGPSTGRTVEPQRVGELRTTRRSDDQG